MKRYGNLYPEIWDLENIKLAHKNARKGKLHYQEVQMVNANEEKYALEIQELLRNKTFRNSEYETFTKSDSGKERTIYKLPYFPDFADESKSFEGDKKKIDEILNQTILVLGYVVKDSKQRKDSQYVTIQFKLNDLIYIAFSGSAVLTEQLNKYKVNIPFYTQIKKIDKYYTFT